MTKNIQGCKTKQDCSIRTMQVIHGPKFTGCEIVDISNPPIHVSVWIFQHKIS